MREARGVVRRVLIAALAIFLAGSVAPSSADAADGQSAQARRGKKKPKPTKKKAKPKAKKQAKRSKSKPKSKAKKKAKHERPVEPRRPMP